MSKEMLEHHQHHRDQKVHRSREDDDGWQNFQREDHGGHLVGVVDDQPGRATHRIREQRVDGQPDQQQ